MSKKKILKKQKISFKDIPALELKKKGSKLESFNASKRMKNKKYVFHGLLKCLMKNEIDGFKEILDAHLSLIDKEKFAKDASISPRTLFRMVTAEGNPTLDNVCKVLLQLQKTNKKSSRARRDTFSQKRKKGLIEKSRNTSNKDYVTPQRQII